MRSESPLSSGVTQVNLQDGDPAVERAKNHRIGERLLEDAKIPQHLRALHAELAQEHDDAIILPTQLTSSDTVQTGIGWGFESTEGDPSEQYWCLAVQAQPTTRDMVISGDKDHMYLLSKGLLQSSTRDLSIRMTLKEVRKYPARGVGTIRADLAAKQQVAE